MRGHLLPVSAAAFWLATGVVLSAPGAAMDPADEPPVSWGLRSVVLATDDGRNIIRLLPPTGGGAASQSPSMPNLPFAAQGAGHVPGQSLRLSGRIVEVPIFFEPWPGYETLSYIGIRFDGVSDPTLAFTLGLNRPSGVFVVDTTPGGPAALAGLRFGDFVIAIDGTPVTSAEQLRQEIQAREPGTDGTFSVWRVAEGGADFLAALKRLAEGGSTPAMLFLGRLYSNGTGVPHDANEAVYWYKTAAFAGSTNGMLLYGDTLVTGEPMRDLVEAERWIRQSANAGNMGAVYRLGRMYRDGEGRPRDALEAVSLFKRAADANYTPAMVALGLMLEGGSGIEADHLQAVQWYKRAADAGDADGMAALGTMYSAGRGVERDYVASASWYEEGAKRGQLLAIHNIAVLYDKGLGVGRNPQTAAEYIYRALELGYPFTYQQMTQNSSNWSQEFRKALQRRLASGGYYGGALDGAFGSSTVEAITRMVDAQ